MRRARTDSTHVALLKALRQIGWQVESTHRLANFVDAVGFHRRHGVRLFEFKRDTKAPLTASQERLIEAGWPVEVLCSAEDVIALEQQLTAGKRTR